MDSPQEQGSQEMADMGRRVNIFLVNVMRSSLLPAEIQWYGLCVLEHTGEPSPRARSHGSVPGGGG